MFKYKLLIEKPMAAILISIVLGIMIPAIYNENKIFSGAAAILFVSIAYVTVEKKFFAIIMFIMCMSSINFLLYFSSGYEGCKTFNDVRIEKSYNGIVLGNIKGKNILITGNTSELKEGALYSLIGSFKREVNFQEGQIGQLNVSKIKGEKKDYIYILDMIKINVENKFITILGKEKAAIVLALSFGNTDLLSQMQKDNLKDLGIIHAVSVSGFHIALIYKLIEFILGDVFALGASFLYVIFTGMKAVTMRSFFMILILVLSRKINRNYDGVSSLAFSAVILLSIKPYYIFDIGFSLSYLSTLSILKYNKSIMKKLYKLPQKINESISISLSAMVLTMPYIFMVLKNFSLAFLVGNLFLVPIYSLVVVLGNIAMVINVVPSLFKCVNYVIYVILCCCDGGMYYLMKIMPSRIYGGELQCIMYISVFFAFLLFKKGYTQFKYIPLILCFILLVCNYSFFPTVEYIKYNKSYCFVLRNNNRSILLSNIAFKTFSEEDEIKKYLNIDEIKDINFIGEKIKFDDSFFIDGVVETNNKSILYLKENNKNYLLGEDVFKRKKENFYDIIDLQGDKNGEKAYIPQTISKIIFIFGKPFIIG